MQYNLPARWPCCCRWSRWPCETPSPGSEEIQEPFEHSVLYHADPAGQHAAVEMLSSSDCYPADPADPCVVGGPVGPDDYLSSGTVRAVGSRPC